VEENIKNECDGSLQDVWRIFEEIRFFLYGKLGCEISLNLSNNFFFVSRAAMLAVAANICTNPRVNRKVAANPELLWCQFVCHCAVLCPVQLCNRKIIAGRRIMDLLIIFLFVDYINFFFVCFNVLFIIMKTFQNKSFFFFFV